MNNSHVGGDKNPANFQAAEYTAAPAQTLPTASSPGTFPPADIPTTFSLRIDRIVTSKLFGFPIMLLLLGLIFWLTISLANYPTQWLTSLFFNLEVWLRTSYTALEVYCGQADPLRFLSRFLIKIQAPLFDGLYKTLTWVISVTLPPMVIFFPLFTLLEECGYLPRIALNMDKSFRRCGAHGRQCLTMMMGFGCNACAIMNSDIIETRRERLLAIVTNAFVPCNGRFPTLIILISIFFAGGTYGFSESISAALILTSVIILGIVMTLISSKLLSMTLLKGMPSNFEIVLPAYKKPRLFKVLFCSIFERTIFVLGRAMLVAAPAGVIIWVIANCSIGDASILSFFTQMLDPFGHLLGLDGVILMAFMLGLPANEIVMPIILMAYMAQGSLVQFESLAQLQTLLIANGWTHLTAICTMLLCLMHFPCATTLLTIHKETGSLKWTAVSFALPTICGITICTMVSLSYKAFLLIF